MEHSEKDLITTFYQTLLLREPDPEGLEAGIEALRNGILSVKDVLLAILRSNEFSANHTAFVHSYVDLSSARFTNDVSQYGEVGILLNQLVNAGASHKIVVDVGARGRMRSNSYDLMRQFGWRGLLIEANPNLLSTIADEFRGLDCKLLNYAVSNESGVGTFFLGTNDDVSSLSEATAASWGPLTGQVEVAVERLPTILHSQNIPTNFDVLSLDIEGEDENVLNDLIGSSAFRPKWIVIELPHQQAMSFEGTRLSDQVRALYKVVGYTEANLVLEFRSR